MPYVDEDERRKVLAGLGGAAAPVSAGGAAPAGGSASGSGFVNLERILGLNSGGGQGMASDMLGQGEALRQRAASTSAAGDKARASNYGNALTGQGGREAAAMGLYGGRGGETSGGAAMDAFLSGGAGGNVFNVGAGKASELERILGTGPTDAPRTTVDAPGVVDALGEERRQMRRDARQRGKGGFAPPSGTF